MAQSVISKTNRQRILMLAAALLALLVLLRYGPDLWQFQGVSLTQTLELKKQQYQKLSRIVASSDSLHDLNTSLKQKKQDFLTQHFISGGTESLSKATLQNIVKKLANDCGLNIRTTRMLESLEHAEFDLLRMSLDARAEIGQINNFLLKLRSNPHFLFVQRLEIKQIHNREARFFYFNAQVAGMTL